MSIACDMCNEQFLPAGRGLNNQTACQACRSRDDYPRLMGKNKHIKRKFGIRLFDFREMLEFQNHGCAICTNPLDETGDVPAKGEPLPERRAVVDHCHTTGAVRGILCHPCNIALGMMRDSTAIASKALQYLVQHESKNDLAA